MVFFFSLLDLQSRGDAKHLGSEALQDACERFLRVAFETYDQHGRRIGSACERKPVLPLDTNPIDRDDGFRIGKTTFLLERCDERLVPVFFCRDLDFQRIDGVGKSLKNGRR